ncbi:ABC transporter permease [Streptococcus sp.]|jgi:ABC-2 type transport system permease protein|uniref:ABC transporter permease n=1 Tax=Streptococcus sp. TaxID=1306 RepID=UPI003919C56C
MKRIFHERRQAFLASCLKYSRYVLNDHFVLVLLVLLGFLSLQYRQLLENFPQPVWPVYLLLLAVSILLFFAGSAATYLEEPDQHFLLTKEGEILELIQQAIRRQFVLWGLVQSLGQLLFLPLYLKLGLPVWGFGLYLLVLTAGKYSLIQAKWSSYTKNGIFQWGLAIDRERKRQQSILQFFALFTRVKGITSSVKRRSYLDGLLKMVAKRSEKTWDYLYLRAFLRSGDFWGLTIRLFTLSLVALLTIDLAWLAVGLVLLFDYLLLFQLLALYGVYDYQYLNYLYPIEQTRRTKGFLRVLRGILYSVLGIQSILALFLLEEKMYLGILILGGFILNQFYLAIKAKKLID